MPLFDFIGISFSLYLSLTPSLCPLLCLSQPLSLPFALYLSLSLSASLYFFLPFSLSLSLSLCWVIALSPLPPSSILPNFNFLTYLPCLFVSLSSSLSLSLSLSFSHFTLISFSSTFLIVGYCEVDSHLQDFSHSNNFLEKIDKYHK